LPARLAGRGLTAAAQDQLSQRTAQRAAGKTARAELAAEEAAVEAVMKQVSLKWEGKKVLVVDELSPFHQRRGVVKKVNHRSASATVAFEPKGMATAEVDTKVVPLAVLALAFSVAAKPEPGPGPENREHSPDRSMTGIGENRHDLARMTVMLARRAKGGRWAELQQRRQEIMEVRAPALQPGQAPPAPPRCYRADLPAS
jgi:hypothetical protein